MVLDVTWIHTDLLIKQDLNSFKFITTSVMKSTANSRNKLGYVKAKAYHTYLVSSKYLLY